MSPQKISRFLSPSITLLFGLSAIGSAAETLSTLPDSAVGLGMSGGRYANLTDPSAIHYTPANIADVTHTEAEFNVAEWYGDVRFTQAHTGESEKLLDPWKTLGSFYFAQPIVPGKLTFGLGVTTPYGLSSNWPKDGPLRYLIPYEATLLTIDINPVIAFKPVENLSIGIGLDIMYSSITLRQLYPWSQAVPGLPLPDGTSRFDADGWGVGAFAGITWKLTPRQRISLIGRLPLNIDYSGSFEISHLPSFLEGTGVTSSSDFKSDIRFPGSIAAGYGIDVTDRLTLGLDFLWAANSSHKDVPLNIGNNQSLLGTDGLLLKWKDSIEVGTGMEYKLDNHWTLRAGYLYSQSSQRDTYYTPSVPSNDRHLLTAGIGYQGLHHSFNLAYSYSLFPDRNVDNDVQPAFDGKYQISWQVISASYTYNF